MTSTATTNRVVQNVHSPAARNVTDAQETMPTMSLVQKMMRLTGRLRYILGPASSSPLDHEMTDENKALLEQQRAATEAFVTVTRADGSTYLVPKDPLDQSLR